MSRNRSKLAFFEGVGHFQRRFQRCQKTRVIAVSCGIKIFAVRCLVLSQYTHLTDGQTDRIATAIPCVALHAVAR